MNKILVIGNSFSTDATYYLHQIASAGDIDTKVVNLYIGGCNLETHWHNIKEDKKAYLYEENGKSLDKYVSIREALLEEKWDYVITQQASYDSGIEESYFPYLSNMLIYIKELVPKAECLLHETWAYETDSTHDAYSYYHHNQIEMYDKLKTAYEKAAEKLKVNIIPSGDMIQQMRKIKPFNYHEGGKSLCRDGYHLDLLYGRYLVAALWYEFLFSGNILKNQYVPHTDLTTDTADTNLLQIIKENVHEYMKTSR